LRRRQAPSITVIPDGHKAPDDTLVRRFVGSSVRRFVGSSVRRFVGSSVRRFVGSRVLAGARGWSTLIAAGGEWVGAPSFPRSFVRRCVEPCFESRFEPRFGEVKDQQHRG
jgi:hypothetical protein